MRAAVPIAVIALSNLWFAAATSGAIVVSLREPVAVSGSGLHVRVDVQSPTPIVTGRIASGAAISHMSLDWGCRCWVGNLLTGHLPYGPQPLTVTLTDANGQSGSLTTVFERLPNPTVTVTSPRYTTVTRGIARITATCFDDQPAGCASLEVRDRYGQVMATAANPSTIDVELDLSKYGSTGAGLFVRGTDADGYAAEDHAGFVLETSPHLRVVTSVIGEVDDFDGSRVLSYTNRESERNRVVISRLGSGAVETVSLGDYLYARGLLTPRGCLLWSSDYNILALQEYRDGLLREPVTDLGGYGVNGGYAWFISSDRLYVRDLAGNAADRLVDSGPVLHGDIDAEGRLVYEKDAAGTWQHDVMYFDGTSSKRIATSTRYSLPQTDGGELLYAAADSSNRYTAYLYDGATTSTLATKVADPADHPYDLRAGWAVFWTWSGLVRRAPGQSTATVLATPNGFVRALAPNGEFVMDRTPEGKTLRVTTSGRVLPVAEGYFYSWFFIHGRWYIGSWDTLFRVEPPVDEFSGDDRSDVLWRHSATGTMELWRMDGTAYDPYVYMPSAGTQWKTSTGDFNGDGQADVLLRNWTNGETTIWFMSGGRMIGGKQLPTLPAIWESRVGDFNGDSYADLLLRNTSTSQVSIWLCNDGTIIGGGDLPSVPRTWEAYVADFNADGKSDVLWRNATLSDTAIWFLSGTQIIGGQTLWNVPAPWTVFVGNFNADPYPDILWRNPDTGEHGVWLLRNGRLVGGGNAPHVLAPAKPYIGDFDGDGASDVLWHDDTIGTTWLWIMGHTNSAVWVKETAKLPAKYGWTVGNLHD